MAPVPKPKRDRTNHYFREWREKRGLTQYEAMELLGWSQSKISRLETGLTPYNQDDLEAAAVVYGCSTVDLITARSAEDTEIASIVERMNPATKNQALKILRTLAGIDV